MIAAARRISQQPARPSPDAVDVDVIVRSRDSDAEQAVRSRLHEGLGHLSFEAFAPFDDGGKLGMRSEGFEPRVATKNSRAQKSSVEDGLQFSERSRRLSEECQLADHVEARFRVVEMDEAAVGCLQAFLSIAFQ